jgi:hypothetical protein
MLKPFLILLTFIALSAQASFAVTSAPHITDREIVEALSNIRGDIKRLEAGQASLEKRFDDMNNSVNKRFDDMNNRFGDMNKRFDTLEWMLGLFITIAMSMMGAMLWMIIQQQQRLARVEQSLETQKDEISFLKTLIEKLLPPRGVL